MSSSLWFSHRVCPSQLPPLPPSCLPVSSFLHSLIHWGQHLDCAKCLCVMYVCVRSPTHCSGLQFLYSKAKERGRGQSLLAGLPVGFSWHVKLAFTSRQSVTSGAGWCKRQLKLATSSVDVMRQQQFWWRQRRCGGISQLLVGAKRKKGWGGFSERRKGNVWMKESIFF